MNEAQKLIQLARKAAKSAQSGFVPGLRELLMALADYIEAKEGK